MSSPKDLDADTAYALLEQIRPAEAILRDLRDLSVTLGWSSLNIAIALDGLQAATKTIGTIGLAKGHKR